MKFRFFLLFLILSLDLYSCVGNKSIDQRNFCQKNAVCSPVCHSHDPDCWYLNQR